MRFVGLPVGTIAGGPAADARDFCTDTGSTLFWVMVDYRRNVPVRWVRRVAPDASSTLAPAQPVEFAPEGSQWHSCSYFHWFFTVISVSQHLFLPALVLEGRPEC